jgi:DnaJ-class molecular chaperone
MESCKHCASSGIYIDYVGYPPYSYGTSVGYELTPNKATPCKYCQGKGYIDENEFITVPRKYVKDEYFDSKY